MLEPAPPRDQKAPPTPLAGSVDQQAANISAVRCPPRLSAGNHHNAVQVPRSLSEEAAAEGKAGG